MTTVKTTAFNTLDDLDVAGKRVLVRLDLNVPMADGKVTDLTRIERSVPTVRELSDNGARVVVLAHFGRPKGERNAELTLAPVAAALAEVPVLNITMLIKCYAPQGCCRVLVQCGLVQFN